MKWRIKRPYQTVLRLYFFVLESKDLKISFFPDPEVFRVGLTPLLHRRAEAFDYFFNAFWPGLKARPVADES